MRGAIEASKPSMCKLIYINLHKNDLSSEHGIAAQRGETY